MTSRPARVAALLLLTALAVSGCTKPGQADRSQADPVLAPVDSASTDTTETYLANACGL